MTTGAKEPTRVGERRVSSAARVAAPGHPEGADRRLLELELGERSKSSASFGLELGKPASIICTPSSSRALHDLQLLGRRERHALPRMPSRKVVS